MSTIDIAVLHARLYRLTLLLGMAAGLEQQVNAQLRTVLGQLDEFTEDADLATAKEILANAVAQVQAGQQAVAQAVTDAIGRLGDNATAEDIAAAKASLEGVAASQAETAAALAQIDPDNPEGGGVVGNDEGGVEPAPEAPSDGGGG